MIGWSEWTREQKEVFVQMELQRAYHGGRGGLSEFFYHYRTNEEKMQLAIEQLINMEARTHHARNFGEYTPQNLMYRTTILYAQSLLEMLVSDSMTKTKHGHISYAKVIDRLLPYITMEDNTVRLDSIAICTVHAYMTSAKEIKINSPLAYMKSCIWTILLEGTIREETDFHFNFG